MSIATPTVIDIDPADIGDHPHNPRFAVGDVSDLAASIAVHGVLQPLTVAAREKPKQGETPWVAIMGHRRRAAAVEAEQSTVPCLVRTDLDTTAKQLEAMLEENDHREDLTPVEEAAAYQQLVAFDYSQDDIARVTGRSVATIRGRLDLMKLSDRIRERVHGHELTLTDAAALVEFADNAADLKRAEEVIGTHQFPWVVADIRRVRAGRDERPKVLAKLKEKGVKVVVAPRNWEYGSDAKIRPVTQLAKPDGSDYTKPAKEHADCPGHVAVVSDLGKVTYGCAKPDTHPKRTRTSGYTPNPAQVKLEEDLETASRVRVGFMAGVLAGELSTSDQANILAHVVTRELTRILDDLTSEQLLLAADLLGLPAPSQEADRSQFEAFHKDVVASAAKASVPRLVGMLAAAKVLNDEFAYGDLTGPWAWKNQDDDLLAHMAWLQGLGYKLSDVERELLEPADEAAAS